MRTRLSPDAWLVTQSGFDRATANVFETLFTVGNGYLGTRGTLEEGHEGELSGTYLAGVFDSHDAAVADLVNAPDWLSLSVHAGGVRLDVDTCVVVAHDRILDMAQGLLWRSTVFEDERGRRTRVETLRFASQATRDLCGLRMWITPLNHTAPVTVEGALDGRRRNLDRLPAYPPGTEFEPAVRWDKWAKSKHLKETAADAELCYLQMRTIGSGVDIGYACAMSCSPAHEWTASRDHERVAHRLTAEVAEGDTLTVTKLVTIATSRDAGVTADQPVRERCLAALTEHAAAGFDECLDRSVFAWQRLWADADCEIVGDPAAARAVRFSVYHLLIAANPDDPTVSVGAKSLSGEGYRGHVFWDTEILMLPFYLHTRPAAARSLLRFRHHTLPGARDTAARDSARGARYPWEVAGTGHEECPLWTPDGRDRIWTGEQELHVTADVAYAVLRYVEATGDTGFLTDYGARILFETSRYWADRVDHDEKAGTYHLRAVMGPDEFHPGVDDNAFTNRMVSWHLEQAVLLHDRLTPAEVAGAVPDLTADEVERWRAVAAGLVRRQPRDDGVIEQFDGYFGLDEIPVAEWDDNDMPRYPAGYHHFNTDTTTLVKQPDVLMLMYLLPDEFSRADKVANFRFYEPRTLHKSSLSPAIHAIMGIEIGEVEHALRYFTRSAFVDLADNQGNTAEGIHIASAGGTWQLTVCGFGGMRVQHGMLTFDPWLPAHWKELRFRIRWRGDAIGVAIEHTRAVFTLDAPAGTSGSIVVRGRQVELTAAVPKVVQLSTDAELVTR